MPRAMLRRSQSKAKVMPSATLNLRVQPYRLMTTAEAAHYCRRPVKKFQGQCPVAPVVMPDGDKLYDVQDLDKWIDGLKHDAASDDEIIGRLK